MSITLCEGNYHILLNNILDSIQENGWIVCSLHSYTIHDQKFETYVELLNMLSNKSDILPLSKKYRFFVKPNDENCDFVFVGNKINDNFVEIKYDLI